MIKIGDVVINVSTTWCSGFIMYNSSKWEYADRQTKLDRRKFLLSIGCTDCSENYRDLNLRGIVVDKNEENDVYLIRWDNGGLCGKPSESIQVDQQATREKQLNNLL